MVNGGHFYTSGGNTLGTINWDNTTAMSISIQQRVYTETIGVGDIRENLRRARGLKDKL